MAEYLEEFLYRGRSPGDDTPPAWHINIVNSDTGVARQLNMSQAEEEGWTIKSISRAINTATAKACDQLRAELTTARSNAELLAQQLQAAHAVMAAPKEETSPQNEAQDSTKET